MNSYSFSRNSVLLYTPLVALPHAGDHEVAPLTLANRKALYRIDKSCCANFRGFVFVHLNGGKDTSYIRRRTSHQKCK